MKITSLWWMTVCWLFNPLVVLAQPTLQALTPGPQLELPPVGRMLWVFMLVVALAWIATVVMRRVQPMLTKQITDAVNLTVLGQRRLARGVQVYLITADGQRFLIVESSRGVAIHGVANNMEDA